MEYLTERIIKAAQAHGEDSEPAHEIGDLQRALRAYCMRIPIMHEDTLKDELADILEWDTEETET